MSKISDLREKQKLADDYELVSVTPDIAREWLRLNTHNRAIRKKKVDQYTELMMGGKWFDEHLDPLAFDSTGNLLNGQHRLLAIVRSGKDVKMWVRRNVPPEMAHAIDKGVSRDTADSVQIYLRDDSIPKHAVSMFRRVLAGLYIKHTQNLPYFDEEIAVLFNEHKKELMEVERLFASTKKGVSRNGVRAAVARAWISRADSHERIKYFVEILYSGRCDNFDKDSAAISLRDALFITVNRDFDVFAKTENALSNFLDERPLKKAMPATIEKFPLSADKYIS